MGSGFGTKRVYVRGGTIRRKLNPKLQNLFMWCAVVAKTDETWYVSPWFSPEA